MLAETFFDFSMNTAFVIVINTILYGFIIYLVVRLLKALWKHKK